VDRPITYLDSTLGHQGRGIVVTSAEADFQADERRPEMCFPAPDEIE
jgi:hypothetical protein